ncbi:MAG TPA: zinc ribbon domain-containing protein [Chloroflexi bacterium]|nr:zinc ribbon domain-containing protein [Chloroflexota bacterium]
MPIYTYRCENCGIQFERQQKFSDEPLKWCPECHQKALRKVYTPVGIVFKGSGFYATDHRSPSGNGRAAKNGKHGNGHASAKTGEKSSATTESASAAASTKSG